MKSIGGLLVILGIGSILLNQFNYEFMLLKWIDNWGEMVAWAIRGGAIALGAILWIVGYSMEGTSEA